MNVKSTTEVRSKLSAFIRQVNETGECIVITDYRTPVAMLCPRPRDQKASGSPTGSDED